MCIKHVETEFCASFPRANGTGQESMPVTFNVADVKTINIVINQTAKRNTTRHCF